MNNEVKNKPVKLQMKKEAVVRIHFSHKRKKMTALQCCYSRTQRNWWRQTDARCSL